MNIITEDLFLQYGLRFLIQQKKITLLDNEVIFDFDHNFIILTTSHTLAEIKKGEHSFERFLLHPCLKIKKNLSLKELSKKLNYKTWNNGYAEEFKSPLTRKERAIFACILNAGKYSDMFSNGVCDSNTFRTHKYNILRKMNIPSIATLAQVHNRWENYLRRLMH